MKLEQFPNQVQYFKSYRTFFVFSIFFAGLEIRWQRGPVLRCEEAWSGCRCWIGPWSTLDGKPTTNLRGQIHTLPRANSTLSVIETYCWLFFARKCRKFTWNIHIIDVWHLYGTMDRCGIVHLDLVLFAPIHLKPQNDTDIDIKAYSA